MNLKEIRQKAGISAKTVALELNCSRDHIYDIEKGKTSPKIAELEGMAKCYNTTLHELIFGNRDEELEAYQFGLRESEKNLTELQNEFDAKCAEFNAKCYEIIELRKEVDKKDGKIQNLKNHCEFLENTGHDIIEKRNAEYDALDKDYKELAEAFNELSGLNADLQKLYDDLKTANAAYEVEIDGLNETIERLDFKLRSQLDFSDDVVKRLNEAYTKIGYLSMKYKAI